MYRRPPRSTLFPYPPLSRSRRYVTLPAELFNFGDQSAEDRAEGCGTQIGNGDQVGPLWIVDATDFGALGGNGGYANARDGAERSEEHTAELQSRQYLVCRLL